MRPAILALNTYAGRREYRVDVVQETPTRYRIVAREWIPLPRRNLNPGDVALVPKGSIRFAESDTPAPADNPPTH